MDHPTRRPPPPDGPEPPISEVPISEVGIPEAGDAARALRRAAGVRARWHANLLVLGVLLPLWFVGSFVCGIFFVEALNTKRVGHAPLGFWIAHQGSIYLFVLLIFVYAWWMDRVDRRAFGDEDEAAQPGEPS